MSEPNLVHNSWLPEEDTISGRSVSVDMFEIASQTEEALERCFDPLLAVNLDQADPILQGVIQNLKQQASTALAQQRQLWEREHDRLLAELMQARSLSHGQIERIRHLEQALDQSLTSLNDLRLQMIDQQFLETQLASTEEIANVQQQAILRLKLQLAEQKDSLDNQLTQSQERDRSLQELLTMMETLTQTHQTELGNLREQIAQDRAEAQIYQQSLEKQLADFQAACAAQQQQVLSMEAESLAAHVRAGELDVQLQQKNERVQELSKALGDRQATIDHLEAELKRARKTLEDQPTLIMDGPQASRSTRHPKAGSSTEQDLAIAQAKLEELETEISRQLTAQAILQHACQEMEGERDCQQSRIVDLENQTADMQEQILRQAQQASEYETAVQHWKDRYVSTQSGIAKLKELLEQVLPDPPAELSELLAAIQASTSGIPEPATPSLVRASSQATTPKVDLPDFLMRRRSYKTKRS